MKRILLLLLAALTMICAGEAQRRTSSGKIYRSESAKHEFLKEHGYKHVPPGYEVDHIVPLWEGGADDPSNMQFLTKEQHRLKTTREAHIRHGCRSCHRSF